MRFSLTTAVLGVASMAEGAKMFKGLPLGNGFPSPSNKAIPQIEKNAGGYIPAGALPSKISPTAAAVFQLVAHQEIFEVDYFTSLLKNITNDVPGYTSKDKKYLMRNFRRIRAQEELHALGANGILAAAGEKTVTNCKYSYPVSTLADAIALGNLFTEVVLGAIPQVQALLVSDTKFPEETGLVPLLGAILAQEGQQSGYFRSFANLPASGAPFLTPAAAQFAATALKSFIVPGSCEFFPAIPTLLPLTSLTVPAPKNSIMKFAVEGKVTADMYVAYVSGVGAPFVEKIEDIVTRGKTTTFEAKFPFMSGMSKGLTIAAVVKTNKGLTDVTAVADNAVYGPGLYNVG